MTMQHFAEIGILAALAVPALWAVASPGFRRVFPYDARQIALAAGLYLAGVAALALYEPDWLRVPALLAAVVIAYLSWRARPNYGSWVGLTRLPLPPGALLPLAVRPWNDPGFFAMQARRYGNVFKATQFGRPMVCIVGLERANRLLLAEDANLYAPPLPFSRYIEGGYLRYLPEETHVRVRRTFSAIFDPGLIALAEPRLAGAFREGLAAMARACSDGDARHGELVKPHLMRTMFAAWADLFFGIGPEHSDFARLKELSRVIDTRKARWARPRRVHSALDEIEAILRRRAESFDGSEACFLRVLAREIPGGLVDRGLLGNLIYIMEVSWGDVCGLLIWVFKKLDEHPEWRERLTRDLQSADGSIERAHDLATRFALETLRFEQSEHRYRRTKRELEFEGFRIPKDWLIRICVRESHQDAEIFHDPERFDPERFRGRVFTRAEYAPFGAFRLACIGEHLTKTTARIFATELVAQYDWHTVEDGPAQIGSWAHNAPNPRWRARLVPHASGAASHPG